MTIFRFSVVTVKGLLSSKICVFIPYVAVVAVGGGPRVTGVRYALLNIYFLVTPQPPSLTCESKKIKTVVKNNFFESKVKEGHRFGKKSF